MQLEFKMRSLPDLPRSVVPISVSRDELQLALSGYVTGLCERGVWENAPHAPPPAGFRAEDATLSERDVVFLAEDLVRFVCQSPEPQLWVAELIHAGVGHMAAWRRLGYAYAAARNDIRGSVHFERGSARTSTNLGSWAFAQGELYLRLTPAGSGRVAASVL